MPASRQGTISANCLTFFGIRNTIAQISIPAATNGRATAEPKLLALRCNEWRFRQRASFVYNRRWTRKTVAHGGARPTNLRSDRAGARLASQLHPEASGRPGRCRRHSAGCFLRARRGLPDDETGGAGYRLAVPRDPQSDHRVL